MSLVLEEIHHHSANKNKNDDAYQSIIVIDMCSLVIIEMLDVALKPLRPNALIFSHTVFVEHL